MKQYDLLIVGAGLFGATLARIATDSGRGCLVIDRRDVAGGNLYCQVIDGIAIHRYGAHIFHTSNRKVWDFVTSLVDFNRYTNCPVANYRGELYNLPFNMNTFHALWGVRTPAEAQQILDGQRAEARANINGEPANLEEQALLLVGRDIYNKLIKDYTEKQWGRPCRDLPAFIIRRLPVRMIYDNNYFNDSYQGIPSAPDGYNTLIARLLEGSDVWLGIDFHDRPRSDWEGMCRHIVYTGPIDRLYGYRFGPLEYRSVRFDTESLPTTNYQGNAVVNYTDADTPFTRIIEHKHFASFGDAVYDNPRTVISREYSVEWKPGTEPFYPVNTPANTALYERYRLLADADPDISVAGRLGSYRYFDMDKTIEAAFDLAGRLFSPGTQSNRQ